jgi:hypothetical protein
VSYVAGKIEKGIFTQQERMEGPYRPPESLTKYKEDTYFYNNKSDIWGLGMIFYQILTNNSNFFYDSIYTDLEQQQFKSLSNFYSEFMNDNNLNNFLDMIIIPKIVDKNPTLNTPDYQKQLKSDNQNQKSSLSQTEVFEKLLKIIDEVENEGVRLEKLIEPINTEIEKLSKEEVELYRQIVDTHPILTEDQIVENVQSRLIKEGLS